MPRPKKIKNLATEKAAQTNDSKYNFFTEADYNQRGEICSMVPSWAMTQMIDDLESAIDDRENWLRDPSVPAEARARIQKELEERKERYAMVTKKPKIDQDKLYKLSGKDHEPGSLGEKIKESNFSFDDMMKGVADGAIELRRSTEPCIKLSPEEAEIARGCNVKITDDGKLSRNDAVKVWKFSRLHLGELSNPEILRR
jgi:hypothetical protein